MHKFSITALQFFFCFDAITNGIMFVHLCLFICVYSFVLIYSLFICVYTGDIREYGTNLTHASVQYCSACIIIKDSQG